jgi:hypothetical protein
MRGYDEAIICENGHKINTMSKSSPEFNTNFCKECGGKSIDCCKNCNVKIKGHYHIEGDIGYGNYKIPKFCFDCGTQYPWTNSKINAANELVKLSENLNSEEIADFSLSIKEIVEEKPNTVVAQTKVKRYLSRVGSDIASGLRDILVDVISETISKSIWGR